MSPWLKYLLFQVPGWIATAIILVAFVRWEWIPEWLAVLGFVGWLLKDLLLYRFLRRAYEPEVTGSARLVGERGITEGELAPEGYIRVRGELWRALANPLDTAIRSGTEVEIISAEGMQVVVRDARRPYEAKSSDSAES